MKKYIPNDIKRPLKGYINSFKKKGETRIFCISVQKNGTTSVGNFFKHFDYPVATWFDSSYYNWPDFWLEGDFEKIFDSTIFKNSQVFEDSPWWFPEFYKELYFRFPDSKFILLTRDSESWFKSMLSHSKRQGFKSIALHSKVYNLKIDLPQDNTKKVDYYSIIEKNKDHYINVYETRNKEIINFFKENDPNKLFHAELTDPDKWIKLGNFIGIDVSKDLILHSNKSKRPLT